MKIKTIEELNKLPDIIELRETLEKLGYTFEVINDGAKDNTLYVKLLNGKSIVEVKVSDTITLRGITMARTEYEIHNEPNLEDNINKAGLLLMYIANKYGYRLSYDRTYFLKINE